MHEKEIQMHRNTQMLCLAALALSAQTAAAGDSLAEQVVGSWELVSLTVVQGDRRIELFGDRPRGIQTMGEDGRFTNIITRESLPLYASANRMQGTEEEYRTILQGSNSMFGTYTVDEEAGEVIFQVDVSTYPNWEGDAQRKVSMVEDGVWRYVNPATTVGAGNVEVVWRRFD
jgi:hypothetical protein